MTAESEVIDMAGAQGAYRLYDLPERAPERVSSPSVRALPGGRAARENALSPAIVTAAKLTAIVMVVLAVVCFARLSLASATVTTMIQSDATSSAISEARAQGNDLEVEQTVRSNSATLKAAAADMGMVAPESFATIVLDKDVVATDAEGALSLSESVKNVVEAQE